MLVYDEFFGNGRLKTAAGALQQCTPREVPPMNRQSLSRSTIPAASLLLLVAGSWAFCSDAPEGADVPRQAAGDVVAAAKPKTTHWAFQPVKRPVVPQVADASWPRNAIDHFILARLEAEGLR